jgi:hypothetical protein
MPAIGGLLGVTKVSGSGRQSLRGGFAVLSLALKFAFPGNRRPGLQRLGSRLPLNAKEGQASGAAWTIRPAGQRGERAHAVRERTVDCSSDQIGCKEGERDCHVHLARRAALAFGNRFGSCDLVDDEFFKPTTAASNRGEQSCAIRSVSGVRFVERLLRAGEFRGGASLPFFAKGR